ncbi:MAG: plastocyanin/azurin family copper-binding protein, partial [Halofilum sp. (in: g-proteobacteria)]
LHAHCAQALAGAALLTLSAVAWSAGGHDGGHGGDGHGHSHGGFSFGEPAQADAADRTVEIAADEMDFSPESVQVEAGETVRFVVENTGQVQHAFTLGTPEGQVEHEQEMQGMPMEKMAHHMRDEPNGLVVQPGETKSLTWRFAEGGPVQFACHIPGHYPAGMKGRVRVN